MCNYTIFPFAFFELLPFLRALIMETIWFRRATTNDRPWPIPDSLRSVSAMCSFSEATIFPAKNRSCHTLVRFCSRLLPRLSNGAVSGLGTHTLAWGKITEGKKENWIFPSGKRRKQLYGKLDVFILTSCRNVAKKSSSKVSRFFLGDPVSRFGVPQFFFGGKGWVVYLAVFFEGATAGCDSPFRLIKFEVPEAICIRHLLLRFPRKID